MAPPKKQRKIEETETTNDSDGVIRFELSKASELGSKHKFSSRFYVRGVPWQAKIARNVEDLLDIHLICVNKKSFLWSVDAKYSTVVCHPDDDSKNVIRIFKEVRTFKYGGNSWGCPIAKWSDLVEGGFLKDDKLVTKIEFTVTKISGLRPEISVDFKSASESYNGLVLVLKDENIHVSKELLAMHSPVFNTMFFGPFNEKNKKIIPLEDVDPEEFKQMLQVLYPSRHPISDANVDIMLKLGDRFVIKAILDMSEDFLISTMSMTLEKKLLIAEQYRLASLQDQIMMKIQTQEEIRRIKGTSEFKQMNDNTKSLLLDKMVELMDKK